MILALDRWATRLFAVAFVGPVARLTIRFVAWRLIFRRIKPSQISRDEALAVSVKLAAGGKCSACGAVGPLDADHYRPRWAGGTEDISNLHALCYRCHDVKTGTEKKIRERLRKWRARNGAGRLVMTNVMPTHRWTLLGLIVLGLIDGGFGLFDWWVRGAVIVIFALGIRWQVKRRARIAGEDNMVRFDADDERARYASTTLGDHVAVTQRINVAKARTRAAIIWFPAAYLSGLFLVLLTGV